MNDHPLLDRVSVTLARNGFLPRGGFSFAEGDDAPPGPSTEPAKSVLLVGQAGSAPWPHFRAWLRKQPEGMENPLDTWSWEVIGAVADEFGARAVSPSDRPFLPFQQWAMRAEGLKPSPLGILMHPRYGLWHAYRGALLFDVTIAFAEKPEPQHLCDSCVGKPCLHTCPVEAFSGDGFAHEACLAHLQEPVGTACREEGCLARNACPYGLDYRYPADEQAFHMRAFMR